MHEQQQHGTTKQKWDGQKPKQVYVMLGEQKESRHRAKANRCKYVDRAPTRRTSSSSGLGLLYSLPGAQLSARGIGEAAVRFGLGVLPVLGAAWLQTDFVDARVLLLCIPVSGWVTAILIINEVPDIAADRAAHKRTLVVRFGASGARRIYGGLSFWECSSNDCRFTPHRHHCQCIRKTGSSACSIKARVMPPNIASLRALCP
jgi:hypothetical protein